VQFFPNDGYSQRFVLSVEHERPQEDREPRGLSQRPLGANEFALALMSAFPSIADIGGR
jgi:hypothetical protein